MEFDCKIKGGHRQATREGDNLLDFNVTQDSRVTVNEDGTITITGKGGFTLALKRFTAKANTKYYIKWELVSGTVDTSKSNGNSFLNPLDNTNIKQGEFKESVVENDKDINGFWINNMAVFTNAVIKFWANTNKNDFEQYGASPSPDYPSEIETVGSNVNLFDKDNVNKLSGYIDKSGYLQYDTNNKIIYVKCEANTDYVISSKNIRGVAFLNKVPRIGLESTNFKILTTTELTLNSKENTYLACWYYSSKLSLTEQEILNSIKIEKGTVATAYSLYNQGSVKMDVVNKNLLNMQKKETSWTGAKVVTENNKVTFIGASNGTLGMSYNSYEEKIKIQKGNKITYSSKYESGSYTSGNTYYNLKLIYKDGTNTTINMNRSIDTYKNDVSNTITLEKDVVAYQIIGSGYQIIGLNGELIYEFQLEYQPQTITMPIQQEMLTGDYIEDIEHHEWKKLIITGDEIITYYNAPSIVIANNLNTAYFTINISERAQGNSNNIISNMFKNLYTASAVWGNASSTSENLKESIAVDSSIRLRINKNRLEGYDNSLTSNEKIVLLKTYLKSLYDAGNPLIVYYKLATPTNLELTAEQKAIREQKLYTYKNITNISLSDELASVDISYKKDQNTVNNKLQSQINELKELLNTTQTSALLLDNLQKDVESEV